MANRRTCVEAQRIGKVLLEVRLLSRMLQATLPFQVNSVLLLGLFGGHVALVTRDTHLLHHLLLGQMLLPCHLLLRLCVGDLPLVHSDLLRGYLRCI